MRRAAKLIENRLLPRGWRDVLRQLLMFGGAYVLYEVVRGLVDGRDVGRATLNATRVIDLERTLHVFVEPRVEAWASHVEWLMDIADWIYINAHVVVTVGALVFAYARRNAAFYAVRNMFMIAMLIALFGYAAYPTAPPRLMPAWGFTDPVGQLTAIAAGRGPGSSLLNLYAAIPSMHVCFALMTGATMRRFVTRRAARLAWGAYPAVIAIVVVVTGNHYLTDVVLGAMTAGAAALLTALLTARLGDRQGARAKGLGQATA
jgi:membrane-associated phospholipid phosphatase